jgi:short-subunit dehydrogenase involved in D-alanine esterification of teichoic acids
MLGYDTEGKLNITDREKFNNWLGKNYKQINKLDINNKVVQRVLDIYKGNYSIDKLYKKLLIYYWTSHSSLVEFENDITNQLDKKNILFL